MTRGSRAGAALRRLPPPCHWHWRPTLLHSFIHNVTESGGDTEQCFLLLQQLTLWQASRQGEHRAQSVADTVLSSELHYVIPFLTSHEEGRHLFNTVTLIANPESTLLIDNKESMYNMQCLLPRWFKVCTIPFIYILHNKWRRHKKVPLAPALTEDNESNLAKTTKSWCVLRHPLRLYSQAPPNVTWYTPLFSSQTILKIWASLI